MARNVAPARHPLSRGAPAAALAVGALLIAAVLVWQAVTAAGNPDPTAPQAGATARVLDIAVLVFREGLECILVLTAITAGLQGSTQGYRRPIGVGVGFGFLATLATWFVAVGLVDRLTDNFSALSVQAATGLLAIVVLLVVMNWFFHKIYWTGWISLHNRRKRSLLQQAEGAPQSHRRVLWGLALLGLASFYREGVEVVLFLQTYRLQLGGEVVFYGALLGMIFAGIVAILTFVWHQRLPYKRMLVVTGVLLAAVLVVMVGEEVNEMQLAGWIGTSPIAALQGLPAWAGTWFALFPNWETVVAQALAVVLVLGSYFLASYQAVLLPKLRGLTPYQRRAAPPVEDRAPSLR